MKATAVAIAAILLASICVAQDATPDTQSMAAAAQASRAQVKLDQAKLQDIRRLLEQTGAANVAQQNMDQAAKAMRPLLVDALPAGEYRNKLVDLFFEKFRSKTDTVELVDLLVPIYAKYYSDDEVKQLIQLYQSPIGKKMLNVLPNVMAESQVAGQKWGEQLGRQCMMEVLAEHPEMQKAIEEAKANSQPR